MAFILLKGDPTPMSKYLGCGGVKARKHRRLCAPNILDIQILEWHSRRT